MDSIHGTTVTKRGRSITTTRAAEPVRDDMERLAFSEAEAVRSRVGLTQQEFAALLGITPRTYSRRAEDRALSRGESLQVEMIAEVLDEAERVFRDDRLARDWLVSPIVSLDNREPLTHLTSIAGYERVKDTLGKIEFGLY